MHLTLWASLVPRPHPLRKLRERVVWLPRPFAFERKGLASVVSKSCTTAQGFVRANQIAEARDVSIYLGSATRSAMKKIEINKTNGVPNQYTEYLNLISLKQPNELSQLK